MKKWFVFFSIVVVCVTAFGQRKVISGTAYDASAVFPIENLIVYNLNTGQYEFGAKDGSYQILAGLYDTLLFSSARYRQSVYVVDSRDFSRARKDVILYHKAFVLPNVTIYGLNPTYEGFKKDVASTKLPESYKNLEDVHLSKEDRANAAYKDGAANVLKGTKVGSPITWLYSAFNKKEKMRQLAAEMEGYGDEVQQVSLKYNQKMVSEITGLEGDELMNFMMYCHFSYYDIIRWSRERIIENVKSKFYEYEYLKALEDDDQ